MPRNIKLPANLFADMNAVSAGINNGGLTPDKNGLTAKEREFRRVENREGRYWMHMNNLRLGSTKPTKDAKRREIQPRNTGLILSAVCELLQEGCKPEVIVGYAAKLTVRNEKRFSWNHPQIKEYVFAGATHCELPFSDIAEVFGYSDIPEQPDYEALAKVRVAAEAKEAEKAAKAEAEKSAATPLIA